MSWATAGSDRRRLRRYGGRRDFSAAGVTHPPSRELPAVLNRLRDHGVSHERTESSELAKKAKDKADDDKCAAKTKSGRPCRHPKGFRTDHPGVGRCYRRGGASPNGNKAAVREQMASLATEVDIEPQEVLLNAIRRDWGAVQWCGNIIGQLEYALAQSRESGDMESVVILEKRLLGFEAVYGE